MNNVNKIRTRPVLSACRQLVCVEGPEGGPYAAVFWEKRGPGFVRQGPWPAMLGQQGLGKQREGDGKTPLGLFRFTGAFGIRTAACPHLPFVQITPHHLLIDDSRSRYYNRLVDARQVQPDWQSAERIVDYPNAYALALRFSYNTPALPGKGSAVVLHCIQAPTTQGCIALPEEALVVLLQSLSPGARLWIRKRT